MKSTFKKGDKVRFAINWFWWVLFDRTRYEVLDVGVEDDKPFLILGWIISKRQKHGAWGVLRGVDMLHIDMKWNPDLFIKIAT